MAACLSGRRRLRPRPLLSLGPLAHGGKAQLRDIGRCTLAVNAAKDYIRTHEIKGNRTDAVSLLTQTARLRTGAPFDSCSCAKRRNGSTRAGPLTCIAISSNSLKTAPSSNVTAYVTAGTNLPRSTWALHVTAKELWKQMMGLKY